MSETEVEMVRRNTVRLKAAVDSSITEMLEYMNTNTENPQLTKMLMTSVAENIINRWTPND